MIIVQCTVWIERVCGAYNSHNSIELVCVCRRSQWIKKGTIEHFEEKSLIGVFLCQSADRECMWGIKLFKYKCTQARYPYSALCGRWRWQINQRRVWFVLWLKGRALWSSSKVHHHCSTQPNPWSCLLSSTVGRGHGSTAEHRASVRKVSGLEESQETYGRRRRSAGGACVWMGVRLCRGNLDESGERGQQREGGRQKIKE